MMPADDLIYALKKLGWTQVALARSLAVDTCTINNVIHGRTTSKRLASSIAGKIHRTAEEIWPERYPSPDESGDRKGRQNMSP